MTTLWTENQLEEREHFEGYRPLITHGRKRNTIPAEIPKVTRHWARRGRKQRENPPAPMPGLPPSTRKRVLVRRDKAVIFKAKVEAAIKTYQAACGRVVRLADASLHAARTEARDSHADDQGPMIKKPGSGKGQLP